MTQEVMNFARFYASFNRLPCTGDKETTKQEIVMQWTGNRTGSLLAFGHCAATQNAHQLTIYAVLADESKWYYTYDVTDQIHSAPDQRNVHIVLDGLPLPKPIVNGGGFQPSVDEWQSVDVDIEM